MRKSSKQQKLYTKFLKSKNPEHELKYKSYKNFFEKLEKKFKQNYYSNLLESTKTMQTTMVCLEINHRKRSEEK